MEIPPLESEFFGSGVLWALVTFPAYWLYQWTVEREPFGIWRAAAPRAQTRRRRAIQADSRTGAVSSLPR